MRQVYDYERGQWVWCKDASEREYERAVRQEMDRARAWDRWNRRRAGEESSYYGSYYGNAHDRDKFRRDGEESSYYGPAYDRDKKFR